MQTSKVFFLGQIHMSGFQGKISNNSPSWHHDNGAYLFFSVINNFNIRCLLFWGFYDTEAAFVIFKYILTPWIIHWQTIHSHKLQQTYSTADFKHKRPFNQQTSTRISITKKFHIFPCSANPEQTSSLHAVSQKEIYVKCQPDLV